MELINSKYVVNEIEIQVFKILLSRGYLSDILNIYYFNQLKHIVYNCERLDCKFLFEYDNNTNYETLMIIIKKELSRSRQVKFYSLYEKLQIKSIIRYPYIDLFKNRFIWTSNFNSDFILIDTDIRYPDSNSTVDFTPADVDFILPKYDIDKRLSDEMCKISAKIYNIHEEYINTRVFSLCKPTLKSIINYIFKNIKNNRSRDEHKINGPFIKIIGPFMKVEDNHFEINVIESRFERLEWYTNVLNLYQDIESISSCNEFFDSEYENEDQQYYYNSERWTDSDSDSVEYDYYSNG